MVSYLKGKVISKAKGFVILEVGGIGFKVFVIEKALSQILEGQIIELHCFLYLKRETIELYGFLRPQELEFFKKIEGLPGIGPKTAQALTPFNSLENLKKAIGARDPNLKGLGEKKLERIIQKLGKNDQKELFKLS